MNNCTSNELKDEVLQGLCEAKDYYFLSCNSDFGELVKKVKENIRKLDALEEHDEIQRGCVS